MHSSQRCASRHRRLPQGQHAVTPDTALCAPAIALGAADVLPWNKQGLQLVADGINGASRAGDGFGCNVDSVISLAANDAMWASVSAVAAAWWRITVDAFALESNTQAPRYWSQFATLWTPC